MGAHGFSLIYDNEVLKNFTNMLKLIAHAIRLRLFPLMSIIRSNKMYTKEFFFFYSVSPSLLFCRYIILYICTYYVKYPALWC